MSDYLAQYKTLLDAYNRVIRGQYMDEVARAPLFKQMDLVWVRMTREQREAAVKYAEVLYERGLGK